MYILLLLLLLTSGIALVLFLVVQDMRTAIEEADWRFDEEVLPFCGKHARARIESIMTDLRKVI